MTNGGFAKPMQFLHEPKNLRETYAAKRRLSAPLVVLLVYQLLNWSGRRDSNPRP